MLRSIAALAFAFLLTTLFALEASAIEAGWMGKGFYKYKEVYEDDEVVKKKKSFRGIELDTSTGFSAELEFKPELGIGFFLNRRNDRKGVVIPAVDPEDDYSSIEDFINALPFREGTADVWSYKIKFGGIKVNKKFNRAEWEVKFRGGYTMLDGPREGENVRYNVLIRIPRSQRIPF